MKEILLLNPPRGKHRSSSRRSPRRHGRFGSSNSPSAYRPWLNNNPTSRSPMATRFKSRRSPSKHRRRRLNPPKMTSAMKAKISRAVKAAHRRGVYSKARRPGTSLAKRPTGRKAGRRVTHHQVGVSSHGASTPIAGIRTMFSRDVIMIAAGAASAGLATSFVMSRFGGSLPGANTTWGRIGWRIAIPATAAWAVRRYNKQFSDGLLIGGVVMAINSLISQFMPAVGAPIAATGAYPVSPASPIAQFGEYLDPVGDSPDSVYNSQSAFSNSAWD